MSIPRLAIQRPVTMLMLSGVIVLLGAVSLLRLPVDLMPDISFPSLTIRVSYPGAGPLEIEELVTRPIEQSVAAVAGLEQINSTSAEGQSVVRLNFVWGTDLNEAADDVRTRIDRIRARLPEAADAPILFKFDATTFPIIWLGVEGDYDPVVLRDVAEHDLVPRLERVAGVAAVDVNGGARREIRVELSREKITALRLLADRVINLLRTENQNIPVGEMEEGDLSYLVRSQGQFASLDDIRNLVVRTAGGGGTGGAGNERTGNGGGPSARGMAGGPVPVYLRDIAEVRDTSEDVRQIMRINGKPGIRLNVTKQSGENTVAVASRVRDEVQRINREVTGVRLSILNDTSVFIDRSIAAVREAVLLGSVLVIAIIFIFLRNARSTLIICTAIPISIIGTFALLFFGGFTLNTITFGGLALGVGMIVDAAIVVLENTFRHLEAGKSRVQAAIEGSEEVWSAILASTLTHIAVFVPLLFLSGVSSILFRQLSIVVIFSLAMSLVVAVAVVPVLCANFLRLPVPVEQRTGLRRRLFGWSEGVAGALDDGYRGLLHRALQHRPTILGAGAATFVLALVLLPTLGFELVPPTDEGQVTIDAELPVGTRIERTQAAALQLEEMIRDAVPEAETIITQAGGGFGPGGGSGTHRATIAVNLVGKRERTRSNDEIAQALRRQLSGLPGVLVRARASGGNWSLNRMLGAGGDERLALEIRGHDLEDARRLGDEARALMLRTPGVADARITREEGRPELAIRVDRSKAALFGLTVSGVANTLQTNIAGTQAAFYRERGNEYPIVVRLRAENRSRIADIDDLLVSTPAGQVVPAKSLMDVRGEAGPVQIERKNQERITRVTGEVERALSRAVAAVQDGLQQISVPPDFAVGFGGEVEEQARAFGQLQLTLLLAIFLVYAVMASQYESLRDPFVIMFSVPLAAIGVVLALKLTATTFSLQAFIGVIMLAGIVVSNAILLVDYTNVLRRRDGMALREAVELAGRRRLRPILMTSLTTVLGLAPMSLGIGEGAELQAPLARVVIGGLLTSTLITLVLVPAVYTLFEEGWGGLRRRTRHQEAAGPA